ncbi:ribosome maturation factor RimM [Massilia sp. TS11]|uniref:ribosome maturation factor RimM n=1 Tax=Massilia sp. TS11 TaxID=2908003 RepID=UPI001EDACFA3|nr:ribosome maturation factor RimM [Massilia sp. TS11]MCG2585671.1 ribosome maturation factor RimM [Massilia sp. TS11]
MTDTQASVPADLIEVGYLAGAYGVVGMVRVRPHSTEADALLSVKTWWLEKSGHLYPVQVRQARYHSGDVVARFDGPADRDAAEALKGHVVKISRAEFPALPEDEYYWTDLIGLQVINEQGETIGTVHDMMHNGAQSILRVERADASETLIPFVDQFVKTVDLAGKRITVDWGLDY